MTISDFKYLIVRRLFINSKKSHKIEFLEFDDKTLTGIFVTIDLVNSDNYIQYVLRQEGNSLYVSLNDLEYLIEPFITNNTMTSFNLINTSKVHDSFSLIVE